MKRDPYDSTFHVGDPVITEHGKKGVVVSRYGVHEEIQVRFETDEVLAFTEYGYGQQNITREGRPKIFRDYGSNDVHEDCRAKIEALERVRDDLIKQQRRCFASLSPRTAGEAELRKAGRGLRDYLLKIREEDTCEYTLQNVREALTFYGRLFE